MSIYATNKTLQLPFVTNTPHILPTSADEEDSGNESDYSLDYEFPGPPMRDAEIEDIHIDRDDDTSQPMFDMWDDDPYNDFTWESNDMQLTKFMKRKVKQLKAQQQQQHPSSFWNKSKEWPKQLPYSCSSTNHDQSANAICLVQSNYGIKEKIYAVYRDRIIECGKSPPTHTFAVQNNSCHGNNQSRETTWIEGVDSSHSRHGNHVHNRHKFLTTHQSISLSKTSQMPTSTMANDGKKEDDDDQLINKFKPYSKFIKRKDYSHGLQREHAYLSLGFDPQCLAIKYGYMAIGGVEGEFELYCCMKQNEQPIKIWGTKFKGNNNVMLMTNAIQIIRLKNTVTGQYEHMLIACMNEAGLLVYQLPSHHQCQHMLASGGLNQRNKYHQSMVTLHSHLRSFQGVPINDAKLSPDGTNIVCVGDDSMIFMIDVYTCAKSGKIQLGTPRNIVIPTSSSTSPFYSLPYSSQYVAWSPSSKYFAHTSDSHNLVFIWKASTQEIIYTIDA
ncbi:hypothetical protein BDF20DRAFT_810686, partial [Mycotypha africana]|uniref:uncharacterized protein n=1 Tax=Mycotypha africana TaxID=64632 RepID=UPI002300F50B